MATVDSQIYNSSYYKFQGNNLWLPDFPREYTSGYYKFQVSILWLP